ncbi:MAG TPA: outer membrane beta-barrel protein [Polyangia bacterium]|nr:outer membrane beta-barrel protein [Polyangia bacterium]
MSTVPRRGKSSPRPLRPFIIVLALLACVPSARAEGSATVVAVLAPHESRLADEIKRELESSKFEVLSAEVGARNWQDAAREVDGGRLVRGVVVEQSDKTITVYTRPSNASAVETRLVLSVDPADRMARRHAALSVVEFLHALGQSAGAPQADADDTSGPRRPPPSPRLPVAPSSPETSTAPVVAKAGWQIGAGTSFDVETNSGGPTSHLQFIGIIPFSTHVAFCARALWPLLAAQTRYEGNDVRSWTFGVAASLQYTFRPDRRLRPFLGMGVGTRLGLTETTSSMSTSQGGQTLTTSATLGVEGGIRYSLGPFLQVFFELGAARAFLIPPVDMVNYERAAADGESAHAAVGVMFES